MKPLGPYTGTVSLNWHFGEIESIIGISLDFTSISFDDSAERLAHDYE